MSKWCGQTRTGAAPGQPLVTSRSSASASAYQRASSSSEWPPGIEKAAPWPTG